MTRKAGRLLAAGLFWMGAHAQDVMTRPADPELTAGRGPVHYSAKITMEDGTTPPVEMSVIARGWCRIGTVFGNGTVTFSADEQNPYGHSREARGCAVWVAAPGVRSQYATLQDGGVIVLKRLGPHEGSMISITVLKAPAPARRAYEKGEEALRKRKYPEARKRLEEAVRIYPEYALAWSELGAALEQMGLPDEARTALQRAIEADRMYVKPLVQLAGLEAEAERWPECIKAADAAISLRPVDSPGAYFYRGLAHFHAREWDRAIEMSGKAIELDPYGEFPRAHFLLAASLEQTGQRRAAASVMEDFLAGRRTPDDASRAREYLRRLGRAPN